MEGGRDWCDVGEAAAAAQAQHVAEGATVAHAGQELPAGIDVPLAGHLIDHAVDAGAVGIRIHQRPGRADRRRRQHDEAARARLAQPAPQEGAAVSAAAMECDDQWVGAALVVGFRHIEGEASARARRAAGMHDADLLARRIDGAELCLQIGIVACRLLQEELADRTEECRQGIDRLRGARVIAHGAIGGNDRLRLVGGRAQGGDPLGDRLAGGLEAGPHRLQALGPGERARIGEGRLELVVAAPHGIDELRQRRR
jgi:hypothetical protein